MRNETKSYYKYETYQERVDAWKSNRAAYTTWRKSDEAKAFIRRKRLKQQNLCFICVKPLDDYINIDHIFPLYLGGTNAALNLCITHPVCNMDKGTQVYTTFKEACRRRRHFNLVRKAQRAGERLKMNPTMRLSKKNKRAINHVKTLKPLV